MSMNGIFSICSFSSLPSMADIHIQTKPSWTESLSQARDNLGGGGNPRSGDALGPSRDASDGGDGCRGCPDFRRRAEGAAPGRTRRWWWCNPTVVPPPLQCGGVKMYRQEAAGSLEQETENATLLNCRRQQQLGVGSCSNDLTAVPRLGVVIYSLFIAASSTRAGFL